MSDQNRTTTVKPNKAKSMAIKRWYDKHPLLEQERQTLRNIRRILDEKLKYKDTPPEWRPQWVNKRVTDHWFRGQLGDAMDEIINGNWNHFHGFVPREPTNFERILWPRYYQYTGPDNNPFIEDYEIKHPKDLVTEAKELFKHYGQDWFDKNFPTIANKNKQIQDFRQTLKDAYEQNLESICHDPDRHAELIIDEDVLNAFAEEFNPDSGRLADIDNARTIENIQNKIKKMQTKIHKPEITEPSQEEFQKKIVNPQGEYGGPTRDNDPGDVEIRTERPPQPGTSGLQTIHINDDDDDFEEPDTPLHLHKSNTYWDLSVEDRIEFDKDPDAFMAKLGKQKSKQTNTESPLQVCLENLQLCFFIYNPHKMLLKLVNSYSNVFGNPFK